MRAASVRTLHGERRPQGIYETVFVEDLSFGETKAEEEARLETEKAAEAAGHPEPAPDGFAVEIPEGIDAEIPFR